MKLRPNIPKILPVVLVSVVLAIFSASAAKAQVFLLTIQDSDPDDVIITATGNSPITSQGGVPIPYGVDLIGFFGGNVSPVISFPPVSSTLTTGDTSAGLTFNQWSSDETGSEINNVDLNLLNNTASLSDTVSFTSGGSPAYPAFQGTLSLDLSGTSLPAVGSHGDIMTGFSGGGPNTVIGEYVVVAAPEPSTWPMLLGGAGALAWWRRGARRSVRVS